MVYVFGEKRVAYARAKIDDQALIESGEFKTQNLSVSYVIKNVKGSRCIVIGETYNRYPLGFLTKEVAALKQAMLSISEKEKLRVLQTWARPDYGFELHNMQQIEVASVKSKPKMTLRRFNIL
jgi:hypothetical protein